MSEQAGTLQRLIDLVSEWDNVPGQAGAASFTDLLNELLYHASERFNEYRPRQSEGPFAYRLYQWLTNLRDPLEQQVLLRSLRYLLFVDDRQTEALYRDAYRRIVTRWMRQQDNSNLHDLLAHDHETKLRRRIAQCAVASITASFNSRHFEQLNELSGLPEPTVLGPKTDSVLAHIRGNSRFKDALGCIVLEDFVGTGKQAGTVLATLRDLLPKTPIIFIPLIALSKGLDSLKARLRRTVEVCPVMIVSSANCLSPAIQRNESWELRELRTLAKTTSERVRRSLGDLDDAPENEFGYKGSGALIVTSHNTPNNTLPLLHHRAPHWIPLFRRHHHQSGEPLPHYKDGLR